MSSPSPGSGRVVVVDEYITDPPRDGGSRANADIVRTARELGYHVDVHRHRATFADAIAAGGTWDVALLSRPDTAARCIDQARAACDRVIYLGHDLHHRRIAGEAALGNTAPGAARAQLALERHCWQHSDLSVYPDPGEVAVVTDIAGLGRARWFPYFRVDRTIEPTGRDPAAPVLFLGGHRHLPNATGLRWFFDAVGPLLDGDVAVEVVGDWPHDRRPPTGHLRVDWVGSVSDDELGHRMARASAMIAPLRSGAGVKSKVIDALAAGVPLVTTVLGLQGLGAGTDVAWVSDTATEWPSLLRAARRGGPGVTARSRAGAALISRRYGAAEFRWHTAALLGAARTR